MHACLTYDRETCLDLHRWYRGNKFCDIENLMLKGIVEEISESSQAFTKYVNIYVWLRDFRRHNKQKFVYLSKLMRNQRLNFVWLGINS